MVPAVNSRGLISPKSSSPASSRASCARAPLLPVLPVLPDFLAALFLTWDVVVDCLGINAPFHDCPTLKI
jgi:hypothetical protein